MKVKKKKKGKKRLGRNQKNPHPVDCRTSREVSSGRGIGKRKEREGAEKRSKKFPAK